MNEGKLSQSIDGFELKYIAHTPQNGSGVIFVRIKIQVRCLKFLICGGKISIFHLTSNQL